jgi:hypothetical protein
VSNKKNKVWKNIKRKATWIIKVAAVAVITELVGLLFKSLS